MPHFGRSTIYMAGLTIMFFILIAIGGLGFSTSTHAQLAIELLLVVSTLVNMISIGPACYPIVAKMPSGRLRYKTITIERFVYNLTSIFSNSVTPRMLSPTGMSYGLYVTYHLKLTTSSSMQLGSQSRPLLRRHQPAL